MNKLLRDITTGIDGTTHEIVRVFMVVVIIILVASWFIGTVMELRHAFISGQWDLQSYFQAIGTFIVTVGGFVLMGAGAIKLKTKSEPSGTSTS